MFDLERFSLCEMIECGATLRRLAQDARGRDEADSLEQMLQAHERQVREQAGVIEQTLAEYRLLLESAPDAILVVDEEARIVRVNQRAEDVFGYTRQELLGQPAELLVPGGFWTPGGNGHTPHAPGPSNIGRTGTATARMAADFPPMSSSARCS